MGSPLLAGVYKEHAKTEDSMTGYYFIYRNTSHCLIRLCMSLFPIQEEQDGTE